MSDLPHITLFTLGTSAIGIALILPPGLALAWLLARRAWPGKAVVETLVSLPLFIPPVATGLILLKLFGRHGPFGQLLDHTLGVGIVFTWKAVVLAASVMAFPLLVRAARVAFEEVPPHAEESARTLGATPRQIFLHVTLPLARRGLVAGVILAFARALGEFGATVMIAGFIPGQTVTLALGIYNYVQLGHDSSALALLAVSAALAFLAVWFGEKFARETSPTR